MKVTDAKFTRRYKTGEFEFEEHALTALVEGEEKAADVLASLKAEVHTAYIGEGTPVGAAADSQEPSGKKPGKKAKADAPVEEEETEETEEEETQETSEENEEGNEEEETENEDDEKESGKKSGKSPGKEASGKKTFKKKPQTYSRDSEQHREIFSNVLKEVAPDWKKTPAGKERGKTVSQKMAGKDFLDADGDVLPEFKTAVKKLMKAK